MRFSCLELSAILVSIERIYYNGLYTVCIEEMVEKCELWICCHPNCEQLQIQTDTTKSYYY